MQTSFKEIDDLAEELKALQPMKAEYQKKLDKKFRLEFNYNSNHIEGNTLTYGHTELLLIFDKISGDYDAREIEEMKAHDVALGMIKELAADDERDLTENFIRQLNELILVRPFWKEALTADGQPTRRLIEPGSYKKFPNSVRLSNGEMFEYASPEETPAMMTDLMDFYRSHKNEHPVWQAAMLHYKFVCIHPFDDGNGRVSRLLMNYIMFKNGLPPIIIKSKDKKEYITALNIADATKDETAFIRYIAKQEIWSLETAIRAARGESIDEADDLDKEIALLKMELKQENILTIAGDVKNTVLAFEENIIPIIKSIEEKSKDLLAFFFDYNRQMFYSLKHSNSSQFGVGSKQSNWDTLIKNWLIGKVKANGEKIANFKYDYTFKGYKKSIGAPDFSINIEVTFNDYNYEIKASHESWGRIIIPYGKKLSDEEMRNFYNPLIKQVMESMKQFSK